MCQLERDKYDVKTKKEIKRLNLLYVPWKGYFQCGAGEEWRKYNLGITS